MKTLLGRLKDRGALAGSLVRWGLVPYQIMRGERRPGVLILMYHRIGGGTRSEIDLGASAFERQIVHLRRRYRIISLDEVAGLRPFDAAARRDLVVVTFDDGYEETYTTVYPVLRRLGIPATVYVPARYIEDGRPFDFGVHRHTDPSQRPRPITWEQASEMVRSGLITIGAHTSTHVDLSLASPPQALREIEEGDRLIEARLGIRPIHFAYPWGRWSLETHRLVASRYRTVGLGGPGKNIYVDLDPSRLWRYPVIQSEGYWLFRIRLSAPPVRRGAAWN